VIYAGLGLAVMFPAWLEPRRHILGNWRHPDCLSNHWLFCWIADRMANAGDLLHNDLYYVPVGDAPFLAGNGSDGVLAAPFLWLLGWPAGLNAYYLLVVIGGCWGGYLLCRSLGVGRTGALAGGAIYGINPYVMAELSAGRFSQAPILWLALFLAAFVGVLRRPGIGRALLAAALFAVNAFVYWYYGLFATLAGALMLAAWGWAHREQMGSRLPSLGAFCLAAVALLAWPLWVFARHWAAIPGTAEAGQADIAVAASLPLTWPVHDPSPSDGTIVLSWLSLGLAAAAAVLGMRGRAGIARWAVAALLAVAALFYLLALGPYPVLWEEPLARIPLPFRWLYGLAPPLERFWWPRRHSLLVFLAVAGLSAITIHALRDRLGRRPALLAAVAVALLAPAEIVVRTGGNLVQVSLWEPPAAYRLLADTPGEVMLELPLDPRLTTNQQPLIYQHLHGKRLINGHAAWVPRVRPEAWDRHVAQNTFLAALARHELRQDGGVFAFEASDLEALGDLGLRVVTVNREMYTYSLRDTYRAESQLMRRLFGEPFLVGAHFQAFDIGGWNGETSVTMPALAGPAAVPASFADNPMPGGPFPSLGFGSLNPRTLLKPLPVGDSPRQPQILDGSGKSLRLEEQRLQVWSPSERAWMKTLGVDP
jgi:hypothetical protein